VTQTRARHNPDSHPNTTLRSANWSTELETVRRLFRDYRDWLADHRDPEPAAASTVTRGLGEIDRLIDELPGSYGPPRGEVILAFARDALVACGALREIEPGIGEIKRIYVRADHRGPGFGPRMAGALIDRARALGFERVRVDTLASMTAAIDFYQEMGFKPILAYWPHPTPGALFFEYRIKEPDAKSRHP